MKKCTGCNLYKSLDDFNKGNSRLGRESRCRECKANWRKENKFMLTLYEMSPERRKKHLSREKRRRRWKKEQGDGTIPRDLNKSIIEYLLVKQNYKCAISGESLLVDGKPIFHTDHIIPLSRGGKHSIYNIQLLTPIANLRKGIS